MPYTFGECWRFAALHAPVPDAMLLRGWTQWAYNQFCDRRGWSHLRAETSINVLDQHSGTCGVVAGSPTVTVGAGTMVLVATDVGRAFRVGSIPLYTIIAVNVGAQTATLNRNYSEVTAAAAAATILDAFVTLPEDFHRFISVLDPQNKWRLRFWVSQDLINRWDPARTSTGNARLLASNGYSPVVVDKGKPRYELYPYQTIQRSYPVWYFRKPEILGDDDTIIGPLARRAQEILLEGTLSRCAMWPGTASQKNPYFNLSLAKAHNDAFEEKLTEITVVDEELYFEGMPLAEFALAEYPWNASWLQQNEPYLIG